MATVPVMITFTTGQVVTAAQLNATNRDLGNFLLARPLFIGRQTVAQSIPTGGGFTPITLDTEDLDRDNGHSTSANTSRYVAQTAGYYLASGHVAFALNTTNGRWAKWLVNGATDVAGSTNNANGTVNNTTNISCVTRRVFLNVGDYLELVVFQDSGGALNTSIGVRDQPCVDLQWVST